MKISSFLSAGFLFIATLVFSGTAMAQPDESLKPVTATISPAFAWGGAVTKLAATQVYTVKAPDKTLYHTAAENTSLYALNPALAARKPANAKTKINRTFELVTPGITLLPNYKDEEIPVPTATKVTGWVRRFTYTFPLKIVVKDETGAVEQQIIISDDKKEYTTTFHKNFLKDDAAKKMGVVTPSLPFLSKTEMEKVLANPAAVLKRIERNQALALLPQVTAVIETAYGTAKFTKEPFYLYQPDTKGKIVYPALATQQASLLQTVADLADEKKKAAALESLEEQYYHGEIELKQLDQYPLNYKKMFLYNGAVAALLSGSTARADELYARYVSETDDQETEKKSFVKQFEKIYPYFNTYYTLYTAAQSAPGSPVVINNQLSASAYTATTGGGTTTSPVTVNTDINDPNIYRQKGFVVLNNGQRQEGLITIYFVQSDTSGLTNAEVSRIAYVDPAVKDSTGRKRYAVNEVNYIMIGNRRYEGMSPKLSTLNNILTKASGNFAEWEFGEKAYEKNGFILYQKPIYGNPANYMVKSKADNKTYYITDIVKGNKLANKFYESCPAVREQVKTKTFQYNLEGSKVFVDWLSQICR